MIGFLSKINRKKSTAIFVINCFLFSFVYGNVIAEVSANIQAGKQYAQIFNNFILPYSYGKITETHITDSSRVVIQIQDLHCHPQVQKNISNIIELVDNKLNGGINAVYLEGAYGDVDTSWLKQLQNTNDELRINNKEVRQSGAVSQEFLDKIIQTGRLTGAEYYSALTGKYDIIKGLESKEEYIDNLKRFGGILENQDEILLIIKGIEDSAKELKKRYYNRKQIKVENLFESYAKQEISSRKYYALLSKHMDGLGLDINKYENTSLYMGLMKKEKELKYDEISKDLQRFVFILKEKLPYAAYKMILESTNNFTQTDKLYGYLISLSREFNIDLTINFPELNKFFAYVETSQKINPLELVNEEQRLRSDINSRFSDTKAQREVVFLTNFDKYIKDYLMSKITSRDYDYYKENIETYRKLWVKYVDNRVLSLLDEHIKESDIFYDINVYRNEYFARELGVKGKTSVTSSEANRSDVSPFSLNELINNLDNKQVDIAITGGFHTEGVSEILRNNNISYIVITPNVSDGVKEAEEVYYKIAKLQSKQLTNNNLQLTKQSIQVIPESSSRESQTSFSSSALANMILSLDAPSRTAFINALQTGGDLTKIDVETPQAKKIQEIIKVVQGAKLLESDDNEEIIGRIKEIIEESLSENSLYKGKITQELIENLDLKKVKEGLDGNISRLESILKIAEIRQNSNSELEAQLKKTVELLKEFSSDIYKHSKSLFPNEILSDSNVFNMLDGILTDMPFLDKSIEESANDSKLQEMFTNIQKNTAGKEGFSNLRQYYEEEITFVLLDDLSESTIFISKSDYKKTDYSTTDSLINGSVFLYKGKKYIFASKKYFSKLNNSQKRQFIGDVFENFQNIASRTEIFTELASGQLIETILEIYSNLLSEKDGALFLSGFFKEKIDYKKRLSLTEKIIADNLHIIPQGKLIPLFGKDGIEYLKIIQNRNSQKNLHSTISNKKMSLKNRTFALMYLKLNGIGGSDYDAFSSDAVKNIGTLANNIKTDFDLRIALTAIWELFMSNPNINKAQYLPKESYKNMYENISEAARLTNKSEHMNARSDLMFDIVDFSALLHEMGHNVLMVLFPNLNVNDVSIATLHEIFAYSSAEVHDKDENSKNFESKYGDYKEKADKAGKKINKAGIYEEEHLDAKVFLNRINDFHKSLNTPIDWNLLQTSIIKYIETLEKTKKDVKLDDLFEIYKFDSESDIDSNNIRNINRLDNILKTNEIHQTSSNPITILKETLNKYKNKFLGVRSMASDYDYQKALAGFNNGTNVIPDINGDLDDPASISDILWGLDFAVQNNFNSNEFVVQAIRPAGYEDISYLKQYSKGPLNAFWLGAIVNKLRADGKSEKDIEREILGLVEKTKIEIEMRKTEIIEKMKNSKVEYMSGHLWTYSPFGNEKWPKVNQEGKLDENDAITKMFLIQLEIAASLGIKRVVSHLNSMDVEGYAAFVEHAAGLGITVNFENEILYDAESGYDYNQVLADRGFANHKDFMDSIERIHAKLSDNGKAHFGLLLDMGKALQSFTKSISVDENGEISQEVFEEEAAKLNLDNLKEYYKYVIDRGQEIGVKINEIHLSQMSALSEDLRNEQGKLEKKKVFYKKTKIDQQNNPNLDILKFLEFIQSPGEAKYKFDGLLIQETDGIVPALDLQKTTSKLKTGFVKNAIRSISMLAMTLMLTLAMTASSFLPGFSGKQNNQVESQITVSQEQNIKSDSVLYKDNTKLVEIFSNPENPFAPLDNSGNTSFDAIQQSIDFSNTPETQARVNTAIRNIINSESLKATGFVFDKIPEVFFPRNSAAANVYPATILYEENLIVIPAEHLSYETLRISLETLIAHEYQHKIDAAKVESGKMSMIESEARAMLAGALVIPMAGDFIIIDGQKIDAHEGQKAESFKILHDNDNKKQIKNYFPDADFNNIYYTGEIHRAISQEEYDKLPLKEKKQFNLSLEENELGITLYDTKGDNTKTIYCAVNYQTKEMRIISRSAAQSTINQDGDSGVILKMRGGIPVVLTSFSALISNPLFLITLGVFAAVAVSYFITIKSLNSILDLLDNWELIDKNSKRTQKIVSVIKTPLMLLSFASPSFAKRYNGDSEKRAEIFNRIKKSLLDTINMTEEEFLNVSFVKRISKLLNLNVIKIQYKKHAAFNSASTVSAEDISFISEEIYVNSRFNDIVNLLGKEKITGIAGAVLNSFRNDNWYWDTDPPVHTMYDNLVRVERILQEIYDNTRDGIIDVDKLLADNFKSYRHDSANNLLDNIFTTLFGFETQVFEFEEAMSLHINMSDEDNLSGIKISKNNFVVFNRPAEIPKADYFHGTGKEKEKTAEQKVAGIIKSRVLFKSKEMSVMHAQSHLGVSFANNVNLAKRYSRLDGAVFGFSGDVNAQRTHEAYNYNNGSVIYTLYNGNYHFSEHGSGKLSEIIFFSKEKIDSFLETLTKEGINLPKGVALRLVTDKEDTYYYEADEKDETNIKENVSFEETEAMTRLSKLLDFLQSISVYIFNKSKEEKKRTSVAVGKEKLYSDMDEVISFELKEILNKDELLSALERLQYLIKNKSEELGYQAQKQNIEYAIAKYMYNLPEEEKKEIKNNKYFSGMKWEYYEVLGIFSGIHSIEPANIFFGKFDKDLYRLAFNQALSIINDEKINLRLRLFALLNIMKDKNFEDVMNEKNINISDFEKLGKKFADEYEAGKISIDNDFDLKVVLAGINLEYVLKSKNSAYSGVCSRIAQAANINVGENAVDYFGCFAFRNISHNNLVYRLLEQYSIDKSLSDKDVAEYEIYKRKQLTENRPAMNKTAGYQEDIANLNNSIAKNFGLLSEDKKAELLSKELLTDREMKYFEIANKDEGELLKIIKEEAEDIRLTLFALLNAPSLIGLPKVDAIAAEFIEQFKAGKISIENDFDLQAVIAGINLAVTSNLKKENIFPALYYNKGIYNKIAKAIIVNKWPEGIEGEGKYKVKAAANSNLIFDETDYSLSLEVIAHELGHIYLNILGFTSYDAETEKTMHEFFADVVACAADSIFDSDNAWRRGYSPVKLFLNTKKKEVESHDMARKMISTVRKSFEFIDEQLGDWQIIAKTAVKFIKGGIFDKDNSQTENTKNFIELFAEAMNTEFGVDNKAIINGFKKQETLSLFKYIGFGITGVLYLAGLIFSYIQGSTNSLLLIGMLLPFSLLIFSGYLLLDNTSFINKIKQFLSGIRHARLTTKDSDNVVIEVGENDLQETADIITESAKPLTPDMLYKAEDLKLEEKIDIDFFKGSNIESGIKSFEKRLIDLGIENIPTFGLRGLPQEFYGNNRDSEYMVPINPAQFISLMNVMPNREITEIYTNSSVQDIFIEILRNTFLGLTEGFGNEIEDYANPQLKHTGTFVVYNTDNGYVSNNLNEGDVVYGYYLDNLKTLSYTAAEKGKRWYSKYMSSTDKGEKFAVMLTQSELDGIKKAADDFIRTDLQEYLRKNKYVYDHDYYLKIILPKYINKYLYAKFLENLVQVTEQSIESSKIELTDFSKPILIETDSDVFIVAMWAEESGYPHIERYVANGDRVREKDRYFPIAEFESLTGLKINIDNSNRNRIIIENTGTKNTRLTQFDNKINQSPLQGAAVISDAKISQDLKTAKNLFNGKDAEIFYLDKITGNDVEKYLERMKSGQPVVLYPYSMEINEQLSLQELHSLYMYIADKFSFLQKTLDSAAGEGISFSTIEFLKNAFIHGNKADFNRPIFIESSNDYELAVYNSVNDSKTISNIEKAFMTDVGLTGWHRGLEKISGYGLVSDSSEIEISGDKFYRAVVKNKNSVNPAQAASDLLKQTNPAAVVKETQKIAVKLVVSKDQIEKLNADEIRLEENLVLVENASKAKELQEQGFRTFVINTSEKPVKGNWNKLKTALTDESGNKIGRVYVNKNSGEIVVHSKNKISAEAAAEALSRIISEGVKEQGFEGIRQIIVSMGNAKEETFEAIVGRMKIEHTNKKVKEKALDLTSGFMQREFAEKCRGALVRDDIGVFIITQEQSKNNSGVIRMLQREGMRFVVSLTGEEFYNNGILLDGLQIHAENMAKDEVTKLLKDVEKKRLENADGIFSRITIKLSEKVLSEFSEGVFETYGIMPIIGINSTYGRQAEVEVTSESDVEKALADERVKALNLNDTSILSLVKNEEKKSAKSAYDKGYRAGLCSKFNYSLKARDSVLSLKVFLSKNIDEITEKDVKDIIGVFSEDKDILSYVNYLLAKGEAQEAAGFIRAAAMNTVREEVLDILKNREINIDKEKLLKNEIFQKPYLTLALQLKLSGADLNELFNEEYVSSSMTAAEYLNAIAKEVDMEMKNILNDNDYKVEEIKSGNKEKAAAVFKNFNVLLQDRFRTKGIPKEVKISTTLAVRSILAAA